MMLNGEVGPGELVPFFVGLPEPKQEEDWDTVEVSLAVDPYGGFFGKRVDGLEVTQMDCQPDGFSGTIRNRSNQVVGGTEILEGLNVAMIGYDEAGQVVAVAQDGIRRILEPGWTTTFQQTGYLVWGNPELATSCEARVLDSVG